MAIITVLSATYCHGEEIAQAVAGKLGYKRIEDKLLKTASLRFKIPEAKLVRAMTGPASFWNNFTHEREKNVACLRVVLADLIAEDKKLVLGYPALLTSREISHVLSICIVANLNYRVEQAKKLTGKSDKEAGGMVRKDDEECAQWTQYLFEKSPYEENLYDMVVPMHDSSIEKAADLICEKALSGPLAISAVSELACRDFQIAAQVNLALANTNHDVDVSARHGEVVISLKHHVVRMKQYQNDLKRIAEGVAGVSAVDVRLGPKYRAPAVNTMAKIDLPPKILLVDDEKEFVQTLSERLKKRNFESTVVYDGKQALEFAKNDQPDVMVLDLMMPGIGGIDVLRDLKKTRPNIEIIILTGHGSEQEQNLAAELGAFAYLQKPVNIEVLAQTMRDAYKKVSEVKKQRIRRQEGEGE
ncbi:response regulator [Elusimicrobiota bacterium]